MHDAAYVQAAVYDATTKISRRYQLYHDFEVTAVDASLDPASGTLRT